MARKKLPYFQWYPADAEADERYSLASLASLGLFHRLLNSAWVNEGLPTDIGALARIGRCTPEEIHEAWPFIGALFPVGDDGRRRNGRQEEERNRAKKRAIANARPNNQNASKKNASETPENREEIANAFFPRSNAFLRASESESSEKKNLPKEADWEVFASLYPKNRFDENLAAQYFIEHDASKVLAGLRRAVASEDWRKDGGRYVPTRSRKSHR